MKKTQLAACFIIAGLLGAPHFAQAADPAHSDQPSVAPAEAISKLKEGNGRYTSGNLQHPGQTTERRTELAKTQHPFAGIVKAARETIAAKGKAPGHIESLVTAIKPAVEATAKDDLDTTVRANVKNVVKALRSSTPILKAKVDSGEIQVIGGYYSLDTGAVTLLD